VVEEASHSRGYKVIMTEIIFPNSRLEVMAIVNFFGHTM
jgi:hypothetical protein